MKNVFKPSRRYRRQFAGQPCPGCGNLVAANDLVAFAPGGQTFYLHATCVDVLMEAAADSTGHQEEELAQESTAAGSIIATEETL